LLVEAIGELGLMTIGVWLPDSLAIVTVFFTDTLPEEVVATLTAGVLTVVTFGVTEGVPTAVLTLGAGVELNVFVEVADVEAVTLVLVDGVDTVLLAGVAADDLLVDAGVLADDLGVLSTAFVTALSIVRHAIYVVTLQ
jgi:hypothetical protein